MDGWGKGDNKYCSRGKMETKRERKARLMLIETLLKCHGYILMHSVFTLSLSLSHSHTEIYALQQCKAKKYSTEQKLFGWAAFPLRRRGFHGSSNVNVSVRFVFCVRSSFTWGGAVRKVSREPKNSEHIYLLNIRFPPNSYASDTVIYENIT